MTLRDFINSTDYTDRELRIREFEKNNSKEVILKANEWAKTNIPTDLLNREIAYYTPFLDSIVIALDTNETENSKQEVWSIFSSKKEMENKKPINWNKV